MRAKSETEHGKFDLISNHFNNSRTWQHYTAFHATMDSVMKSAYFTTSGLQWTGERWLLKEKQAGRRLLRQKQVVTTGH